MCRDCYNTTAASFCPSIAITNPELIWSYQQEQKRQKALQKPKATKPEVMPSSASTYSGSTAYSYNKEEGQSKPKRSMRQKIKEVWKDMGNPPTARYDSEHGTSSKDAKGTSGPMNSSPLNQQNKR
ncbi:hypothetical protein F5B20DRAFT_587075 [Whalleya microplaca]|nr:hypothetical protein F5B20DRAFT_587075 [Whalleya microplaca]